MVIVIRVFSKFLLHRLIQYKKGAVIVENNQGDTHDPKEVSLFGIEQTGMSVTYSQVRFPAYELIDFLLEFGRLLAQFGQVQDESHKAGFPESPDIAIHDIWGDYASVFDQADFLIHAASVN
jgi:hypothetical protein